MHDVGEKIKKLRTKLGYSQQELAEFCDIKREVISYYENGVREISLLHLDNIANYLGVDMESLMDNDINEMHPDIELAFRAETLSASDRKEISNFKTIVRNYLKMKRIEADGVEA